MRCFPRLTNIIAPRSIYDETKRREKKTNEESLARSKSHARIEWEVKARRKKKKKKRQPSPRKSLCLPLLLAQCDATIAKSIFIIRLKVRSAIYIHSARMYMPVGERLWRQGNKCERGGESVSRAWPYIHPYLSLSLVSLRKLARAHRTFSARLHPGRAVLFTIFFSPHKRRHRRPRKNFELLNTRPTPDVFVLLPSISIWAVCCGDRFEKRAAPLP